MFTDSMQYMKDFILNDVYSVQYRHRVRIWLMPVEVEELCVEQNFESQTTRDKLLVELLWSLQNALCITLLQLNVPEICSPRVVAYGKRLRDLASQPVGDSRISSM